jgi:crossover junction endodeoxyribonuclease RusA
MISLSDMRHRAAPGAMPPPDAPASFFAPGIPSTKGSTRGFVVPAKGGGKPRAIVTNDAGPKAKMWAAIINAAAHDAMAGRPLLEGAVSVAIAFYLSRPKAHFSSKGLRPNAPRHVAKRPDVDKLARCALDALTGVVFADDAQIARLEVEKRYTYGNQYTLGAHFSITRIEAP